MDEDEIVSFPGTKKRPETNQKQLSKDKKHRQGDSHHLVTLCPGALSGGTPAPAMTSGKEGGRPALGAEGGGLHAPPGLTHLGPSRGNHQRQGQCGR